MNKLEFINVLQRMSGIIAIGLLTLQIYLGVTKKALKFHMVNGLVAYFFVILHPLLLLVANYLVYKKLDPFFVYVDVCVLCPNKYEYLINLGRIGFWLITIAVVAAKFRNMQEWLRLNWRKLHVLNYFAFFFVSFHAINIGSDAKNLWFMIYFSTLQLVVLYSIIVRLKRLDLPAKLRKILDQLTSA